MTNFLSKGRTMAYVVPGSTTYTVGQAILIGGVLFVVMSTNNNTATATTGETVTLTAFGKFLLPKQAADGGWALGAAVYWDVVHNNVTGTSNDGANPQIGWGWDQAALTGDTTGIVKLLIG